MKIGYVLFGCFLVALIAYACGHDEGVSACECAHHGGRWYVGKCIMEVR